MDTTINRKLKKKESERASEKQFEDNIGSNIKRNDEIPKEILEMSDDDPRLMKFMEDIEEERRKRHPNQTHEELKKNVDAVLQSRKKKHL